MVDTYRANLTAAEFPLLTEHQGHTVIVPGIDQTSTRGSSSRDGNMELGLPQIYYMHNMMPTEEGITSVSYQQVANSPADTDGSFNEIYSLRDADENVALFSPTLTGRNYVLLNLGAGWIRTTDKAPGPEATVTVAHVNGQTYICFGKIGVYKYNFTTNVLTEVTLLGLDKTKVLGIVASNGYMVAWTATTTVWSSITNPLDFVPSLVTGAGGGSIQLAKAAITVCLPSNGGFVIYTKKNAVAATYSGNARYPFTFKEIIGAGGLSSSSLSAYDGNSTNQLSYTTSGLQEISMSNASVVLPQVTDFIAGARFEDFSDVTRQFTRLELASPLKKKLTQVGNRYIVISYGVTQLTHAIVIDMALQRWGKLKLNHVDAFEYFYPSSDVVDSPRRSIGFLQADGKIQVCIISHTVTGSFGTVLLGKYQLNRFRYMELQGIVADSILEGSVPIISILSTLDGTNTVLTTTPVLASALGTIRRYDTRVSGHNHSLLFSGAMDLNSLELKYNDAGELR